MGKFQTQFLWLGSVRQWHWISSAVCLAGILLFAFTGITLNHASQISATPRVHSVEEAVPEELLLPLQAVVAEDGFTPQARLPRELRTWLEDLGVVVDGRRADWNEDEIYLSMPRPGGDAWLAIDLRAGELIYEDTDRGWISYLNDLHKARNTGQAWKWFIDMFSVACLIFSLSGLWLLARQSNSRPFTWPVVGLGLVIPALLAILFIHS